MDYKVLMQQAILLAKEAAINGDVPVGALVVDNAGIILGQGANLREQDNDPTAHAEIVAIRNAAKKLGNYRLDDLTMVVTLEPCSMCAGAILESKISRLLFGSYNFKLGAVGSVYDIIRDQRFINNVEVYGGILEKQCTKVLSSFFKNKRNEKSNW